MIIKINEKKIRFKYEIYFLGVLCIFTKKFLKGFFFENFYELLK